MRKVPTVGDGSNRKKWQGVEATTGGGAVEYAYTQNGEEVSDPPFIINLP